MTSVRTRTSIQQNHANGIRNNGDSAQLLPTVSEIQKTMSNKKGRARPLGEKLNQVRESTSRGADPIHLTPQEEGGGKTDDGRQT